jgi:hypothetical protein
VQLAVAVEAKVSKPHLAGPLMTVHAGADRLADPEGEAIGRSRSLSHSEREPQIDRAGRSARRFDRAHIILLLRHCRRY